MFAGLDVGKLNYDQNFFWLCFVVYISAGFPCGAKNKIVVSYNLTCCRLGKYCFCALKFTKTSLKGKYHYSD